MQQHKTISLFVLSLVLFLVQSSLQYENQLAHHREIPGKKAFVTLVYSDGFIEGVRVLGESIRRTKSNYEMILLATEQISNATSQILKREGWRIIHIDAIKNPHTDHYYYQKRLKYAFSKLNIYGLTEFDRLIYLDADCLVVENLDPLFECTSLCSVVRQSYFNTGVIVLQPNRTLLEDIFAKILELPSYNGGEQGFMNSYMPHFARCPLFDEAHPERLGSAKCARISAAYNGDLGVYFPSNGRWPFQDGHPKIIHYTFGPLKPWQWYAHPVCDICWTWMEHFLSLPLTAKEEQRELTFFWTVVQFITLFGAFGFVFWRTTFLSRWSFWLVEKPFVLRQIKKLTNNGKSELDSNPFVLWVLLAFNTIFAYMIINFACDQTNSIGVLHPIKLWFLFFLIAYLGFVVFFAIELTLFYTLGVQIRQMINISYNNIMLRGSHGEEEEEDNENLSTGSTPLSASPYLSTTTSSTTITATGSSHTANRSVWDSLTKIDAFQWTLVFIGVCLSVPFFLLFCSQVFWQQPLDRLILIIVGLCSYFLIFLFFAQYLPIYWLHEGQRRWNPAM